MTREKMAQLGPRLWLVARDGDRPVEVFTMDCGGSESLPVFSHVEEAEMFLGLGRAVAPSTGELRRGHPPSE